MNTQYLFFDLLIFLLEKYLLELVGELCEVGDDDVVPDGLAHQHQVAICQSIQTPFKG